MQQFESQQNSTSLNRRDFSKLLTAAMGGVFAGVLPGCGDSGGGGGTSGGGGGGATDEPQEVAAADIDPNLLLEPPNVCRGLNTCKDHGKGDHECAGQGMCATVDAHVCNGTNDCKGQGGCGEHPGQNTCKGKGACAVPLTDKTWKKARAKFEELAAAKDMKVGPAPAKP